VVLFFFLNLWHIRGRRKRSQFLRSRLGGDWRERLRRRNIWAANACFLGDVPNDEVVVPGAIVG
jgi:hypothetical protein